MLGPLTPIFNMKVSEPWELPPIGTGPIVAQHDDRKIYESGPVIIVIGRETISTIDIMYRLANRPLALLETIVTGLVRFVVRATCTAVIAADND